MKNCVTWISLIIISIVEPSFNHPGVADWIYSDEQLHISISKNSEFGTSNDHERTVENCDLGLCEHVEDYPEDVIRHALNRSPDLKVFFKPIKVPSFINRNPDSFDESEHETMCGSTFLTKWPQKLKNRNGLEKIVVNQAGSYQPVYVDICKKDASCALKDSFPLEYKSSCKQKYAVLRLIALGDDKTMTLDEFSVPCGCVCVIQRV